MKGVVVGACVRAHVRSHHATLYTPLSILPQLFGRDAIYGGTKESERERLLAAFRISNRVNTIFLSRVRASLLFLSAVFCYYV